jgi:hypothetical protein
MSVLHPTCGEPVRNPPALRRDRRTCVAAVKHVEIPAPASLRFSTPPGRSQTGPSEVLRMIRSPYSYNLSFLKNSVMFVAPRSSPA